MMSEEDGDDAGIAPESSSSLSSQVHLFTVRRTFTKMKNAIIFCAFVFLHFSITRLI